jgi:hypothetical protein
MKNTHITFNFDLNIKNKDDMLKHISKIHDSESIWINFKDDFNIKLANNWRFSLNDVCYIPLDLSKTQLESLITKLNSIGYDTEVVKVPDFLKETIEFANHTYCIKVNPPQ